MEQQDNPPKQAHSNEPRGGEDNQIKDKRKRKPQRNKQRGGKKSGQPEGTKDLTTNIRFLQISKLIRAFKPVTLNGTPIKTLINQIKEKETNEPDYFKNQYKNHARLSNLQKYLLEFMKNQPDSTIYISMCLKPSDPEFPFELDRLQLNISIPANYPKDKTQRPKIVVLNDDIPRGFAVNVELGFKRIVTIAQGQLVDEEIELVDGPGLLSMILTLDKYLELFLKQEKKETIKFVKTIKKPQPVKKELAKKPEPKPKQVTINKQVKQVPREVLDLRNQLIDQMCSKLGESVKLFKKSSQENYYKVTLPVLNINSELIPELWRRNKSIDVMLSIPINYPECQLSISMANNFSSNLILNYCQDDQFKLVQITKQYRGYEKNLMNNFSKFKFDTNSLLIVLNWLSNNIGSFCLSEKEFNTWKESLLIYLQ